jgi:hypothetical protein
MMKKSPVIITTIILLTALMSCIFPVNADAFFAKTQQCAFTRMGYYLAFQYGLVYSAHYGNEIKKYDEQDLLPVLGVDTMPRISVGYNYNPNIAFEAAFSDTGVELNHRRNDYTDSGVTQQNYDFDIYNLEFLAVFKNSFASVNTNVYAKAGLAYSYGELNINYATTANLGPSWNDFNKQYHNSFTASAIVPIFDVGLAWSASRYLAITFDYERAFSPVIGNGQFNDPEQSKLQPLNMFLIGALYTF